MKRKVLWAFSMVTVLVLFGAILAGCADSKETTGTETTGTETTGTEGNWHRDNWHRDNLAQRQLVQNNK